VPAQLFHLEGPSLEDLKAQAAALYGSRALIVSAELVTVGGVRGVFARKHYEIVVEVPEYDDDPTGARPRGRRSVSPPSSGIDALVQQAELDEVRLTESQATTGTGTGSDEQGRRAGDRSAVAVSTDSGLFAALMDDLTFATEPSSGPADPGAVPRLAGRVVEAPERTQAPVVLRSPGDLVIVVGAPAVVWEVVQSMVAVLGGGATAAVAVSGPPSGVSPDAIRIEDRLDANAARASGVDGGHPVFLALYTEDAVADARLLLALSPDQVWLAVDAGRKEADTAAWVGALTRSMERVGLTPAGLAVVGSSTTATPETVESLGLPVGWQEGRPPGARDTASERRRGPSGRRRAGQGG
jgi:hypothetical protein